MSTKMVFNFNINDSHDIETATRMLNAEKYIRVLRELRDEFRKVRKYDDDNKYEAAEELLINLLKEQGIDLWEL